LLSVSCAGTEYEEEPAAEWATAEWAAWSWEYTSIPLAARVNLRHVAFKFLTSPSYGPTGLPAIIYIYIYIYIYI
jgi:hypothetical protein